MRQGVIVNTPFANCDANCASDRVAGPFVTAPVVLKVDPWQGHTNVAL
jgi:hypothetical protein